MFILNRYNVTSPNNASAAGAVSNVNPNTITGATGDSAGGDSVTPITVNAEYVDQVISKIVTINIPAVTGLSAGVNNYITVDLVKLGISGVRPVLGTTWIGMYDPKSTETINNAAGATPSCMGCWDTLAGDVQFSAVVNSKLIIKIPTNQVSLYLGKTIVVQLFYSTNNGE